MKDGINIGDWSLAYQTNEELQERNSILKTISDVKLFGLKCLSADIPGNFELDLMREGILEDVYYGTNCVKTQDLENLHLYYFTKFNYAPKENFEAFLTFEGIDTVAEIYLDGNQIGFVENMHHAHRFSLNEITEGEHEIVVHILPVCIYARNFEIPSMCFALKYNQDALQVRKAGSMFGWDIMPRIVSAGIWKPVKIEYISKVRLENVFLYTASIEKDGSAKLVSTFRINTPKDLIKGYTVVIKGVCGEHSFTHTHNAYCASVQSKFVVKEPVLWWPKNYGESNLYDVECVLYYKGIECDKTTFKMGIRTVWLKRTSLAGDEGDFCFIVNGKRIFAMGTNWVPCDAFPSRYGEYDLRNLELANELNCNMIRCWGGNTYPSEEVYDYCDAHGIMIWQDFALACGHYPDDERLCRLVKKEVREIVLEKRQHPSLVVWAGDNEGDCFVVRYFDKEWSNENPPAMLNPNMNMLTRETIARELRNHDATRPYLPSSPFIDETAYRYGNSAESHLWGPRDFFKGEYYGNSKCHFASEIGYHGCPSVDSLKKFIIPDNMPKDSIYDICNKEDWLVHASSAETCVEGNPFAYRLPLMIKQVERIFGEASSDISTFARQSQISQAEAKKFFIEMFRSQKWRKTGILWWNLIDGWPQISDAVVDWYGCKKLAYSYIKRSQAPFCMMFSEPKDSIMQLLATNDTRECKNIMYMVENLATGKVIDQGQFSIQPDEIRAISEVEEVKDGFYLIRWTDGKNDGINHFVCNIGDGWTYEKYRACMIKAGFFDEFEGFDD